MREQTKELKIQEYTDAKLNCTRLSNELLEINTKIGASQRFIQEATEIIDTSNKILAELEHVC